MNLASLWQVPLLLVCENNLYAMGTALQFTHAVQNLEQKGPAYGIASVAVDGMDVLAVERAAAKAVQEVKTNGKPFLLVCNTYRFRAHSMFDAELYREKSEVEAWKKRDPILQLQTLLENQGIIVQTDVEQMETKVKELLQKAVDFAEQGHWEPVTQLTQNVYST